MCIGNFLPYYEDYTGLEKSGVYTIYNSTNQKVENVRLQVSVADTRRKKRFVQYNHTFEFEYSVVVHINVSILYAVVGILLR